jgi:aminobenzoyl-glutamate transport protein
MPYFPLVVAFAQRYVKTTGIGTLTSLMLPYSVTFIIAWTLYLLGFWALGMPLGIQGGYAYP